MKKEYDLIFGLGAACSCSQALRAAKLQFLSFPLDWTAPDLKDSAGNAIDHSLCYTIDTLFNGFSGQFNEEDFESQHVFGIIRQRNRKTSWLFPHDFPPDRPLSETLPVVKAKYERRIQRLNQLLKTSQKVLVVRIDRPDRPIPTSFEDCQYVRNKLIERHPGLQVDFALFSYEKGVPFQNRKESWSNDWLFHVAYDYRDYTNTVDVKVTHIDQNARILSDHFSVRDYRTPEEIRRHQELHLQKKLAKLARSNKVLYWLTRARLGLMRLFSSSASAKPSAR